MAVRALSSTLKTFCALEALAASARPMRLMELTRRLGEPRAAVYQRLVTLIEAGMVEQTTDGAFRLSLRFQYFAGQAMVQADLAARAVELLGDIVAESGETASLAVLDGAAALIVARAESSRMLRADLRIGARLALDSSASGAALVAFASSETRERLAARGVATPATAELAAVRRKGFAVFTPPDAEGVAAVAAPVFDGAGVCVAVIAVSGPASRFDSARAGRIARAAAERFGAPMRGAA